VVRIDYLAGVAIRILNGSSIEMDTMRGYVNDSATRERLLQLFSVHYCYAEKGRLQIDADGGGLQHSPSHNPFTQMSTRKVSHYILVLATIALCGSWNKDCRAQSPMGRSFGFGLVLFEPTGGTIKYWMNSQNAIDADIGGNSYFGALRIDGDYLWQFYPFNSPVANMYIGPGLALGFGYPYYSYYYEEGPNRIFYRGGAVGLGVRVIFGVDVVPRNTPIEIFFQLGPLIGLSPDFGAALDIALGIRFYP
jgi:hypothetical protein